MSQPPIYAPTTDFSGYQAQNPASPYRGDAHDIEFANLETTLTQILINLRAIQRDDGLLKNQIVTLDSLGASVTSFLAGGPAASTAWTPRGAWVTATAYAVKDVVTQGGSTYVCVTAHASGTFATDLAAAKWIFIAAPPAAAPAFPSGTTAKSAGFTAALTDFGKVFTCTGTFTIAFDAAATLTGAWSIIVKNAGAGIITLDPNAAELIDGATTQIVCPGEGCTIFCTGSGLVTAGLSTMPFLEELTASASPSLDLSVGFNELVPGGKFDHLLIEFDTLLMSAGGTLNQRYSADDGATYAANSNSYQWWTGVAGATGAGTMAFSADQDDDRIALSGAQIVGSILGVRGFVKVSSVSTVAEQISALTYADTIGVLTRAEGHALFNGGAATRARLYPSAGTFTSGVIRTYGHRKK
jgi:hypothetical protein